MAEDKMEPKDQTVLSPATSTAKETSVSSNEFFMPMTTKTRRLPEWLDHFNTQDLKVLFKCSVAVWIFTLLIVIEPTLKVIGQATFFGVIVIFIVPPSGIALVGILAGATILLGVCLGWLWGVITMKAALATRPAADLQQQYAVLQQAAAGNTTNVQQASGQTTFQQIAIFEGYMLDTRVTLTYFCMLGLFIYLISRIRVAAPKLALVQMFAIIVTDIFLTLGPLLPTFSGTLPQTLILPAVIAVGISLVCNLLFFPRSTSHIVMRDMDKILGLMDGYLEACTIHLAHPELKMDLQRLKKTKAQVIQSYKALEGNLKFLTLDISVACWSAGDIKSLHDPLLQAVISFASLIQVEITRLEFVLKDQTLLDMAEKMDTAEGKDSLSGGQQFARAFDLRQQYRTTEGDQTQKTVIHEYGPEAIALLKLLRETLSAIRKGMKESNDSIWVGRFSLRSIKVLRKQHIKILAGLKANIDEFPGKVAQKLSGSLGRLHKDGEPTSPGKSQGFVYVLVTEQRLLSFGLSMDQFLHRILDLEEKRTKTRFWWPTSIKDIVPLVFDKDSSESDSVFESKATNTNDQENDENKKGTKSKKKEPSSVEVARDMVSRTRGRRQRSLPGRTVIAVAHWFGNTEGLFALRVLIVSLGLGALAANRNTAGFFYREKGLWALIMAQTSMTPYTADFIYGLVTRLSGTVLGAVIGLAAWYIGAGTGPGSAYGIAAIMIPVILVAMWLRLFASPAFLQGIIIATATTYLVVAYSWVDTHIPSYGNPGVGISVFWRRLLLVLIGFGASTFVTLFPRPPSANKHYRRILISALQSIKDQYALFVATKSLKYKPDDIRRTTEQIAIRLAETLLAIEPQIPLTKFELSTSIIDSSTLGLICHLLLNINQYTTQLALHTARLPAATKARFFAGTGAASEAAIADIMSLLTVVQHALSDGHALPAVLPTPLMERRILAMKAYWNGAEVDLTHLDVQALADPLVRHYLSAAAAFVQLLGSIDELVLVVKRAVGETSYVDLEA